MIEMIHKQNNWKVAKQLSIASSISVFITITILEMPTFES